MDKNQIKNLILFDDSDTSTGHVNVGQGQTVWKGLLDRTINKIPGVLKDINDTFMAMLQTTDQQAVLFTEPHCAQSAFLGYYCVGVFVNNRNKVSFAMVEDSGFTGQNNPRTNKVGEIYWPELLETRTFTNALADADPDWFCLYDLQQLLEQTEKDLDVPF